jgi:hypothetical protein
MRDTTTDVNTLKMMPSDRVTAKPLIGPVPHCSSTSAPIRVVILESRMVQSALE